MAGALVGGGVGVGVGVGETNTPGRRAKKKKIEEDY